LDFATYHPQQGWQGYAPLASGFALVLRALVGRVVVFMKAKDHLAQETATGAGDRSQALLESAVVLHEGDEM